MVEERRPGNGGIRIGPPWLTRFERARIIGARALQLSLGAPPLIDVSRLSRRIREDPVLVARVELAEGVLPITVLRYTRRGDKELIPLQVLLRGMERVKKYWTELFLSEVPTEYER